MISNLNLLLIIMAITSAACQTFQYSRGWTNGKRDGHRREDLTLEKILSPCQMNKLKFLLEGKPLTERLLAPCEYSDEEMELPKRYKTERTRDALYDAFQQ